MKIKRLKLKISLMLLLPLLLLLRELLILRPDITENGYSRLIYPPISRLFSRLSGIFPFSLAEILVYAAAACITFLVLRFLYVIFRSKDRISTFINSMINLVCGISVLYCLFLLLWGFNYYRQPLAFSLDYKVEAYSVADLKALCRDLIENTNTLRSRVSEDENGVLYIQSFKSAAARADIGYKSLSGKYKIFGGIYGSPKPVMLSHQLSYTGIAGIYFPFTGEANVNSLMPSPLLPSTLCHEMAHQRGFAREDEANFIAYLTCKAHSDADFQYSGYLLATVYSMNALYKYDPDSYKELNSIYSDGVRRDLKHHAEFWKKYEGPAEKAQERINDAYLKSNKQADGIHSYGRMVDLLLTEYKNKNTP